MRAKKLISGTGLLMAAALAIAVIIVVNATLTSLRLDLTENGLFTLSQGSKNIVASLAEPVTLDFYFSRKLLADYPQLMNYGTRVRDLLEEYANSSHGKLILRVIEPDPFSEQEDAAVASGLQGIALSDAGDRAYFGLVGTNSTDDESTIPFFQVSREAALEYDITKLIYNLAHPDKRTVGVITDLPLFGGVPPSSGKPWAMMDALREFFNVRNVSTASPAIDDDVDILLIVHPKTLKEETKYAIDQFLLKGGKAIVFVDPLAEGDRSQPDPENPFVVPDLDSDMNWLFKGWGIDVPEGKIAGDINRAMRVQTRDPQGPQEIFYLPWLQLGKDDFNQDDFVTSQLEVVNMGTAGVIDRRDDSPLTMTPLIQTTTDSMRIERDLIMFQRDPQIILRNFVPEHRRQVLAARLAGKVKTAFPDGPPPDAKTAAAQIKEGAVSVILVSDTDILSDIFWVRTQNFFGIDVPQAIANNSDFVVNAVENLSGNSDLISLRSRGEFARPFKVVEALRREAETQFREQEQALRAKLDETEHKIVQMQQEGGTGGAILSPDQTKAIEGFRNEQVKTRKELRAVQHELQKNIDQLGAKLKFINIGLMPLIIALLSIATGLYRSRRYI